MFARTAVCQASSPYTRFVSRIVPELKGPSSQRFRNVGKLWTATKPQFGRAFTEQRALVALGLRKKAAVKPKKVRTVKKIAVAPTPVVPKKAKKTKRVRTGKKAGVAKKVAPKPVVAKKPNTQKRKSVKKAKSASKPRKTGKRLTYKIFRRRVISAAPKGARVSEKFLKDLYTATRLIRNNTQRVAYSKDGVRLVVATPVTKQASSAARKAGGSRRKVKKAAATPVTH